MEQESAAHISGMSNLRGKTSAASTPGSFAPHARSESETNLNAPSAYAALSRYYLPDYLYETTEAAEAAARSSARPGGARVLELAGGGAIVVPTELAERVRGIDSEGDVVVEGNWGGGPFLYPLTPCCFATGKGWESETGVVCRTCFQTVDPKYGDSHMGSLFEVAAPREEST